MASLEEMKAFVRIVENGSISGAAKQMGVAKSAVSRRLKELEGRLGVQLLTRTTRQSSLTDAGRRYHERAVRILDDVTELEAMTSNVSTELTGEIRIAAPLSFGLVQLSPAINSFAPLHPRLRVRLEFTDRHVNLVEEGFDVAVRVARLKDSSLIARRLTPIRAVLCASPGYVKRMGQPQHPADLKNHEVLQFAQRENVAWRFTGPDGRESQVQISSRLLADNGDFLCQAACAGLGIALLPTFIAGEQIRSGELVRIMTNYTVPPLNAYAVYPQTRHLSRQVRAFIDHLVEDFSGEPAWDKGLFANDTS